MQRKKDNILRSLKDFVATFPTKKAAADELKVSPQYLCDMLVKRRLITQDVAQRLGYRKVTEFRSLDQPHK